MNNKHSVKVDVLIIPLCNRIVIVKIFGVFYLSQSTLQRSKNFVRNISVQFLNIMCV